MLRIREITPCSINNLRVNASIKWRRGVIGPSTLPLRRHLWSDNRPPPRSSEPVACWQRAYWLTVIDGVVYPW